MAFVHLLDSIIKTKKQNKQVIFKGITLGKEVFKTIVEMAYEMEVADRIMTHVKQGLLEFSYERKYPLVFREAHQVFDDITKVWKVVHTNKKFYEKGDEEDYGGYTYYSKEKYPLTTSGPFIGYVQITKYDYNEGVDCHLDLWIAKGEHDSFERDLEEIPQDDAPTTSTVLLLQRHIKDYYNRKLQAFLKGVYEFRFRGISKSRRVWEERLKEMEKNQLLVEKLSS